LRDIYGLRSIIFGSEAIVCQLGWLTMNVCTRICNEIRFYKLLFLIR
jgi:hypothetical protein